MPPEILVIIPPGPIPDWQSRLLAALREAGARISVERAAPGEPKCPAPRPGFVASAIFRLEKLWSSRAPTGLAPGPAPLGDTAAPTAPNIRLNLTETVPAGPPPARGDWSIRFSDIPDPLDAARRAVLSGHDHLVITLLQKFPDGGIIRRVAVAGVAPCSVTDTVRDAVALAAPLVRRALATPDADEPNPAPLPPRHRPLLRRLLAEARRDLFTRKQWYLLLGENLDTSPEPRRLTPVYPPADRIWADPFVVEDGKDIWVFFEEMTFAEKRGRIAVAHWDGRRLSRSRVALEEAHHLSFPQLFRHAGRRFMTVESAQAGHVRAYECERWPDRWTPGPVLIPLPLIDPSVFDYAGRRWLLGNLAPAPGARADAALYLFFNDGASLDRWTPHPHNPVILDARHGRSAGRPFIHNGKLYRPAQDCAGGYGRRVVLREITRLSTDDYAEWTVTHLSPDTLTGAVALHTLNPARTVVACDAARRI